MYCNGMFSWVFNHFLVNTIFGHKTQLGKGADTNYPVTAIGERTPYKNKKKLSYHVIQGYLSTSIRNFPHAVGTMNNSSAHIAAPFQKCITGKCQEYHTETGRAYLLKLTLAGHFLMSKTPKIFNLSVIQRNYSAWETIKLKSSHWKWIHVNAERVISCWRDRPVSSFGWIQMLINPKLFFFTFEGK